MGKASPQRKIAPEVELYGGRAIAREIREADPDGGSVVHLKRVDMDVPANMFARGTLDYLSFQASEIFRANFEIASISDISSYSDLSGRPKISSVPWRAPDLSANQIEAREKLWQAMIALGQRPGRRSLLATCAWYVLGAGETLDQFATRMRSTAVAMNPQRAAGLVMAACEMLAVHYGLVSRSELDDRHYRRGYRAAFQRLRTVLEKRADTIHDEKPEGSKELKSVAAAITKKLREWSGNEVSA